MKKTMRFFSLVIAIFMICSLTTAAFATEVHAHSITINNKYDGYEYTAYEIFQGNLGADGIMVNIVWGKDVDSEGLMTALKQENAFKDCKTARDVADVLSTNSTTDNPTAVRFAEIAAEYVSGGKVAEKETTAYVIKPLTDGYYLVVNTKVPEGENTTVSRYMLQVVRDVHVDHKGTYPTVTKKILENNEKTDINEASMGQVVTYQIVGTLPTNIADYNTYFYWFRDTLSEGLTYNDDITILMDLDGSSATKEDSYDVTKYFAIFVDGGDGADTEIHASITDLLTLDNQDGVGAITSKTKFIINYTATLNEYAVIDGPNPNTVDLVYSNNPNVDGTPSTTPPEEPEEPTDKPTPPSYTGETPDATVKTYTTELRVAKVDGQGKPLTGAEFKLTGDGVITNVITRKVLTKVSDTEKAPDGATMYYLLKDGTYTENAPVADDPATENVNEDNSGSYVANDDGTITKNWFLKVVAEVVTKSDTTPVQAYVGDDGMLHFTGLGAGEYTLTETTAPSGYNSIDPMEFTIEFAVNDNTKEVEWSCNERSFTYDDGEFAFYTTVINTKGNTLPTTGGVGTTLFYVFGGLLFAGAAVLLITKKRMAV